MQTLFSYYKANTLKEFLNQIKIDRIVSNHLSSCNTHQNLKLLLTFVYDFVMPTGKTTDVIAMNFFQTIPFDY